MLREWGSCVTIDMSGKQPLAESFQTRDCRTVPTATAGHRLNRLIYIRFIFCTF
jgi:hypothetical protein